MSCHFRRILRRVRPPLYWGLSGEFTCVNRALVRKGRIMPFQAVAVNTVLALPTVIRRTEHLAADYSRPLSNFKFINAKVTYSWPLTMQTSRQYNSCKNSCISLQKLHTSSVQNCKYKNKTKHANLTTKNLQNSSRSHRDHYFIYAI